MVLLALDLASTLGYAVGTPGGVIAHGSFKLPSTGCEIGTFGDAYWRWLDSALSRWSVGEVVFESPILPGKTNLTTLRKLYGLTLVTEMAAGRRHIPVREANLSSIRVHFLGVARAPASVPKPERRAWIKEATITQCRRLGFRPVDDNDADALALFSYTLAQKDRRFRMLGDEIPLQVAA